MAKLFEVLRFSNRYYLVGSKPLYTHAIGDGGVRKTLNACEIAIEINGVRNSRHRVIFFSRRLTLFLPANQR